MNVSLIISELAAVSTRERVLLLP